MEAILNMLDAHRGKEIHIEVGAGEKIIGKIKDAFPEYVVLQASEGDLGLGKIVLMNQIRWFELIADRKPDDKGYSYA
ncbi:MAG: hypothetical protein ABSH28_23040 [Acidobacteriota bacterium]|jgi:hypothetical protein